MIVVHCFDNIGVCVCVCDLKIPRPNAVFRIGNGLRDGGDPGIREYNRAQPDRKMKKMVRKHDDHISLYLVTYVVNTEKLHLSLAREPKWMRGEFVAIRIDQLVCDTHTHTVWYTSSSERYPSRHFRSREAGCMHRIDEFFWKNHGYVCAVRFCAQSKGMCEKYKWKNTDRTCQVSSKLLFGAMYDFGAPHPQTPSLYIIYCGWLYRLDSAPITFELCAYKLDSPWPNSHFQLFSSVFIWTKQKMSAFSSPQANIIKQKWKMKKEEKKNATREWERHWEHTSGKRKK